MNDEKLKEAVNLARVSLQIMNCPPSVPAHRKILAEAVLAMDKELKMLRAQLGPKPPSLISRIGKLLGGK